MRKTSYIVFFLFVGLFILLITVKTSQENFKTSCDPSFEGENPKKCFLAKFNFSEAEYDQLTETEKGLTEIRMTPQSAQLTPHTKTYDSSPPIINYFGYPRVKDKSVNLSFKASLDENNFLNLESAVTQTFQPETKEPYIYTIYYEVDNTPNFNGILSYRYPNPFPSNSIKLSETGTDITNFSGVELNVLANTVRNISKEEGLNSFVKIPFNHSIFKLETPSNRNNVDYGFLYELAQIFGKNQSQNETVRQISNFVKLNLMWGSDSITRAPLDTFLSKIVECGHMNSLVGVMFEMTGGRFRYVSGHDPHLRPLQSNAGHALIEVYSEDTKKWSIVDSYLDIFTENVSVADIATSEYKNLPVLNSINDRDGVLTFGELFKFRKYGDALGRRPLTSMAYIANNENDFGLDWELTKFNVKTKPLATNTKLYVRARVIASKCPIRYVENLNTADGCFGGIVSYSDWKVKTIDLTKH